jgi:hypothetical protein
MSAILSCDIFLIFFEVMHNIIMTRDWIFRHKSKSPHNYTALSSLRADVQHRNIETNPESTADHSMVDAES